MLNAGGPGPPIVAYRGTRLALGQGMAAQVLVRVVRGSENGKELTTLDQMVLGQTGRVVRVRGMGALRRRIMDMGLVEGTQFEVEVPAPLGDPMRVRLKGFSLSLRHSEAAHVIVQPE